MEDDGLLTYKNKMYIPNVVDLRIIVMDEIHQAPYYVHPGYQKTNATARKQYFWLGMKKDVAEYISKCTKCQQVKVEHRYPDGFLQPLPILECKWEVISMDFTTGFPMTMRQHDSIMVVVDKLTKETLLYILSPRIRLMTLQKSS